jgi:hypothetical protein
MLNQLIIYKEFYFISKIESILAEQNRRQTCDFH